MGEGCRADGVGEVEGDVCGGGVGAVGGWGREAWDGGEGQLGELGKEGVEGPGPVLEDRVVHDYLAVVVEDVPGVDDEGEGGFQGGEGECEAGYPLSALSYVNA